MVVVVGCELVAVEEDDDPSVSVMVLGVRPETDSDEPTFELCEDADAPAVPVPELPDALALPEVDVLVKTTVPLSVTKVTPSPRTLPIPVPVLAPVWPAANSLQASL